MEQVIQFKRKGIQMVYSVSRNSVKGNAAYGRKHKPAENSILAWNLVLAFFYKINKCHIKNNDHAANLKLEILHN